MGKKNAQSATLPVDRYRKQIGKQDWKKSKKELKETKQRSNARKHTRLSVQDMVLILVGFLSLLATLYFLFYVYMASETKRQEEE